MPNVAKETKPKAQAFGRQRLSPGAYALDLSAVREIPLQINGQPSTFAEVYSKLRHSTIKEIPAFSDTYVTDDGQVELKAEDWTLTAIMKTLLELLQQGVDPYRATWFYYTHDVSRDADESHSFFVVSGDKVVMENCHFNSETPLILKRKVDDEPIWRSHPYFDEAFEHYWYRKFYKKTMTGQLMVLRPDEPILYHYERPQTRDILREVQVSTVLKTYRLAWVAIPLLVATAFPPIRIYMAVAAGLLGIEVLWLCWTTRKVGKVAV